ncbi:MAG TPA: hypothetical protein VHT91_08820 [Kofleriaceae bacterium]|nr:hypothetical protein [Kofleriaceae bacterium]
MPPFDDDPALFAVLPSFASPHKTVELPIYVAPTAEHERNHVRLALVPIACWRCNQGNFAFDSSFIDPSFKQGIGDLPALIKANPDSRAALFGHADPVGDDQYNSYLSGRRVKAMFALLTRQPALWEALYSHHPAGDAWGDRAIQAMLGALTDDASAPYYTGPVDGITSAAYKDALHHFQDDKGVKRSDAANEATRQVLFPLYMAHLCGDFDMKPEAFLFDAKEKDGRGAYQRCSEFNPVMLLPAAEENKPTAERNADNAVNRRVVLFLFRGDVDIKPDDWPCPGAGEGPARCHKQFWPDGDKRRAIGKNRRDYAKSGDTMACRFYDRFARRSPCEGRPVVVPPAFSIAMTVDATCFAPEVETLTVSWQITGPLDKVYAVRFVVATKRAPDAVIFERLLDAPYQASGSFPWNGEVTDEAFDKFVSLKDSPYLLKLVLETKGGARKLSSETKEVQIVLHSITIHVDGAPTVASVSAQLEPVIKALKSDLESNGGKAKIVLDSPVFKVSSSEMDDDSSFKRYQALWADGAKVPVFARVFVKAKDGSNKRSPHALNATKILWDVALDNDAAFDASLDANGIGGSEKQFIKKVSAHEKNDTRPKGQTAHEHFGGRRAKPVSDMWGAIVWGADAPAVRKWARLTTCAAQAGVDYDAGIHLLAGRMAGDVHHVRALVALDGSLDTEDDAKLDAAPAQQRSNRLTMALWRRVAIVRRLKSGASTTDIDPAALHKEYAKANIDISVKPGVPIEEISALWKTTYVQVVADLAKTSFFYKDACLDDPDGWPVKYRDYDDYDDVRTKAAKKFSPGSIPRRVRAMLGPRNEDDYRKECDKNAFEIYSEVAKRAFPLPEGGMTVFKFARDGEHNQWNGSFTAGVAPAIAGYSGPTKSAFFQFTSGSDDKTFIHEVGHTIFLAHAPGHFDPPNQPDGFQQDAHDKAVHCIMSYATDKKNLCGLCLLQLRGWDVFNKVHQDGTIT